MARAGYDPRDMANVFKTIEKESGPGGPQWMSDHPNPGNRYEYINQEAQALRVEAGGARHRASSSTVQAHLRVAAAGALGGRSRAQREGRPARRRRRPARPARGRAPATSRVPTRACTTYNEGNLFRVSVPSNWRELGSNNTVTFAPDGAYGTVNGNSVFTHGVEMGVARNENHDLADRDQRAARGAAPEQSAPQPRRRSYDRGTIGGRQALHTVLSNVSDATGGQEVIDALHDAARRRLAVLRARRRAARGVQRLHQRLPQRRPLDSVLRAVRRACPETSCHRRRGHVRSRRARIPAPRRRRRWRGGSSQDHPERDRSSRSATTPTTAASSDEYRDHYTPTWGQPDLLGRTWSCPGNHDYRTAAASPYFEYFGEPRAGTPQRSYFSLPLPEAGWHLVSLNSEIDQDAHSPQLQWLRAGPRDAPLQADPRDLASAALGLGRAPRLEETALVLERAVRRARRARAQRPRAPLRALRAAAARSDSRSRRVRAVHRRHRRPQARRPHQGHAQQRVRALRPVRRAEAHAAAGRRTAGSSSASTIACSTPASSPSISEGPDHGAQSHADRRRAARLPPGGVAAAGARRPGCARSARARKPTRAPATPTTLDAIVASGECCAVNTDGKVDVEQAGVHARRDPRRPRQRRSRRGRGFHQRDIERLNDLVFRYNSAGGKSRAADPARRMDAAMPCALVLFGIVVAIASLSPLAQRGPTAPVWPGYKGDGVTLLPNGWRIAPEGRHITVGDLPMNLVPSPDGRFLAISTSGYTKPALSIFDTRALQIVSRHRGRSHLARPRLASRRQAAVRLGLERERHLRVHLPGRAPDRRRQHLARSRRSAIRAAT